MVLTMEMCVCVCVCVVRAITISRRSSSGVQGGGARSSGVAGVAERRLDNDLVARVVVGVEAGCGGNCGAAATPSRISHPATSSRCLCV